MSLDHEKMDWTKTPFHDIDVAREAALNKPLVEMEAKDVDNVMKIWTVGEDPMILEMKRRLVENILRAKEDELKEEDKKFVKRIKELYNLEFFEFPEGKRDMNFPFFERDPYPYFLDCPDFEWETFAWDADSWTENDIGEVWMDHPPNSSSLAYDPSFGVTGMERNRKDVIARSRTNRFILRRRES